MALLPVEDALAKVTEGLLPLPAERASLGAARGRVLAAAVQASLTQPPFDSSAMDGYAVRSEDLASLPVSLQLVGESAAGGAYNHTVAAGEAVRIFTGAPVPSGADSVVPQENTERNGETVTIQDAEPRRHIREMGQDFQEGETVLAAGAVLGAREMMLAAASNNAELELRRKPSIAIIATGDELVPPGFDPAPDQIISSVPYGICALAIQAGAEARVLGIAEDRPDSLADLVNAGKDADILVTIGGASVGDRDLVRPVLQAQGMTLDFWKIAMRPGKPLLFGKMEKQRVLGLPGNPVSAMVCAMVFLKPMIDKLLGLKPAAVPCVGRLAEALEANGERQHYMRATSQWNDAGERLVRPLASQDSSLMAALVKADCLIVRPPDASKAARGARVPILPFDL
ncbi:gephyrin-like molybdotransferase Glp [Methyloligella sp. 2.7D]|uniref:molybdopterin molybdotransferase MoeA n=1 Tax=unclassified Methyloligella TaxID=2625955 RepID=UPI00157E0DC3|nr:gephyrin-like molybdotransferase Glp [Methyloligella sp. GL2]QKP77511.1 molybdopterin molybdotransferase MoeA [Methyloligella sp. GL2]